MPRKIRTAQRPFTMLVANIRQGSDPSKGAAGNPVRVRTTYRQQHFLEKGGVGYDVLPDSHSTPGTGTRMGLLDFQSSNPTGGEGTITVVAAVSPEPATIIYLGGYELRSGEDYVVANADVNTTAANLAAAITLLPGFTANANLADVEIVGPLGPQGNAILFRVGGYSPASYTLTPASGTLTDALPVIGPPDIA
jgi:hypothetical protein